MTNIFWLFQIKQKLKKKKRFEMPGWISHFFYFQIFLASGHSTNFNT